MYSSLDNLTNQLNYGIYAQYNEIDRRINALKLEIVQAEMNSSLSQMTDCVNISFYGGIGNQLLASTCNAIPKRPALEPKKPTIEEMDRILFPVNPIRDWAEREQRKIEEKYSWLKEF
mgnify:CR=1 FL=1